MRGCSTRLTCAPSVIGRRRWGTGRLTARCSYALIARTTRSTSSRYKIRSRTSHSEQRPKAARNGVGPTSVRRSLTPSPAPPHSSFLKPSVAPSPATDRQLFRRYSDERPVRSRRVVCGDTVAVTCSRASIPKPTLGGPFRTMFSTTSTRSGSSRSSAPIDRARSHACSVMSKTRTRGTDGPRSRRADGRSGDPRHHQR